ncbi:MAG: outer membrane protein assembly factor BamB family protein [Planctomycetota bacterium]|jgi:outer membrane protein assembly factor BamB
MMNRKTVLNALLLIFSAALPSSLRAADIDALVKQANVKGGLVVHLGCQSGQQISLDPSFMFHGLNTDASQVEALQKTIGSTKQYGRISAAVYNGKRLPYADNMVNLLIVEDPSRLARNEMMRVLVPNGVVVQRVDGTWRREKKQRPEEMDEWPQWLRGSDNVLVSRDSLVGPPRRLKWRASPDWSRMHNDITVPTSCNLILSADGRLFYDSDTGFPDSDKMPHRFFLSCRDAFNGKLLWRKKLEDWYKGVEYRRGNPPLVIQRRIACRGDRLYATFSNAGPVEVLDAATGKTLRTLPGTESAHEVVAAGDRLFVVLWEYLKPKQDGYQTSGTTRSNWFPDKPSSDSRAKPFYHQPVNTSVKAFDIKTSSLLWERSDEELKSVFPQTLAVDGDRVYCKTPEVLHCLDAATGRTVWTSKIGAPLEKLITKWFWVHKPTPWYWNLQNTSRVMVLEDKLITFARKKLYVVSKSDGKVLWEAPCAYAFVSPPNIFPIGDTLYLTSGKSYKGFDLDTGESKKTLKTRPTGMGHPRCYRQLSTEKYILSSAAGIEFMDLETGRYDINQWTRGNCFAGFIPANGLTYMTPHPCACFTSIRMNGMLAYEPERATPMAEMSEQERLVEGPAHGLKLTENGESRPQDWSAFRKDSKRGASTPAVVPAKLETAWKVRLGSRLSPVTAVGDDVFISAINEHAVYDLDANSGKIRWSYVAGGRVDTPPTVYGNYAVFGCRDGWTYCLSRSDGKLVWRFHGGPQERLIGAYDQLESAWAVHGAVVVLKNRAVNDGKPVVYGVAGRNSFLDSGIHVFALDLATGATVAGANISGPFGEDGNPIITESHVIEGVKADVLVYDGSYLYIKNYAMNMDCTRAQSGGRDHLIATGRSMLDSYWHHRSMWVLNTDAPYSVNRQHSGNLLAFKGSKIFSFRSHSGGRNSGFDPAMGYQLGHFRIDPSLIGVKSSESKKGKTLKEGAKRNMTAEVWKQKVDVICKAMVLTGASTEEVLFVAGTRDLRDPTLVDAALRNKKGGILQAYSGATGDVLAEYQLTSLPVYDGLAALPGTLFIAQEDGHVTCMRAVR